MSGRAQGWGRGGAVAVALLMLLVAGCAAQWAPAYDPSIADGLNATNRDVQTLFATIGTGVDKQTFPSRSGTYARIIGSLDALEIQVKTRTLPPDAAKLPDVEHLLAKLGIGQVDQDKKFTAFPSARAIHDASATLVKMRDTDAAHGLAGELVSAFVNQTDIYLAQAIAYESYLKRSGTM